MTAIKPIPTGYHTVTPYMIIKNAAEAIEFYKKAFNATLECRLDKPDGKVAHADLKIGDSHIMLTEEWTPMNCVSAETLGNSPVSLHLYVTNVDEAFKQAIKAGAKELSAVQNQFYGDRTGRLQDPYGHFWTLSTHVEELSMDEVKQRFVELCKSGAMSC